MISPVLFVIAVIGIVIQRLRNLVIVGVIDIETGYYIAGVHQFKDMRRHLLCHCYKSQ